MTSTGLSLPRRRASRWHLPHPAMHAYRPGPGRDLRLDFLRGLAIVVMIVDHIAGPSWLFVFTGGNRFFTSAAEGFVLLSGLIAGLVYQRQVARVGLAAALRRQVRRAGE